MVWDVDIKTYNGSESIPHAAFAAPEGVEFDYYPDLSGSLYVGQTYNIIFEVDGQETKGVWEFGGNRDALAFETGKFYNQSINQTATTGSFEHFHPDNEAFNNSAVDYNGIDHTEFFNTTYNAIIRNTPRPAVNVTVYSTAAGSNPFIGS